MHDTILPYVIIDCLNEFSANAVINAQSIIIRWQIKTFLNSHCLKHKVNLIATTLKHVFNLPEHLNA